MSNKSPSQRPKPTRLEDLIGKDIVVVWARSSIDRGESQADMWEKFCVLAFDKEYRAIKIQGISSPHETYTGGPLWVPLEHIARINEKPEEHEE